MREEIAKLVCPVFQSALFLRSRIAAGETLNLNQEQATLKGLLQDEVQARTVPDYGGEPGTGTERFLGARYFLACWIDELFIEHSLWGKTWAEQPIERDLFNISERGRFFWEQTARAESRAREDALEVAFLAVMLGYRGSRRDRADEVQKWVDAVGKRVSRAQGKDWAPPEELEPTIQVMPLRGREKWRGVKAAFLVFVFGVVPPFAYLVYTRLLP